MKRTRWALLAAVPALALWVTPAQAGLLTFDLNVEFSGATAPTGGTPWLRATFDDSVGGANDVRLTMSNLGLSGVESVKEWMFNFDPDLDLTMLSIVAFDVVASSPTVSKGVDTFQADGDGDFDIQFDFVTSDFTAGESVSFDFAYIAPITVAAFDFDSAPGPGGSPGPFRSAAHIQNINGIGADSGWIATPEPSAWLLLVPGLLALRLRRS